MELDIVKGFQNLRNPLFDGLFYGVTQLGDQIFFILIAVIVYWTIHKKYAFYFVFIFMISAILNAGLKLVFQRPRPYTLPGVISLERWTTAGYSFPSGHAQAAGVLGYFSLDGAKTFKIKALKWIGIFILIMVPLSRIYLGQHYLSDVIVGSLLAFGVATLLHPLLKKVKDQEHKLALLMVPLMLGLFIWSPTHDLAVACGAFIGFAVGYAMEKRWVGYQVKTRLSTQIFKIIFGLIVLFALKEGLKVIFIDHVWFDFLRYLMIGLWAALGAPWVFKHAFK